MYSSLTADGVQFIDENDAWRMALGLEKPACAIWDAVSVFIKVLI